MRILVIHSYYQIRGGEDAVFEQEANLLSTEHTVEKLVFENKSGWRGAFQFLFSIWNITAIKKTKKKIKTFKPEVVHIHNWHFGCGPAIIRTIKKLQIPVVHTLHNYRLLCPSATLFHNGKLFTDSLNKKFPWKAIKLRVYRNSFLQTFWLALIVWFHKLWGTWNKIDKFIVLSPAAEELFLKKSDFIPINRVVVKPNFIVDSYNQFANKKEDFFLYAGRLSEEKGIEILLKAFANINARLLIAGTGPMQKEVELAAKKSVNIEYCNFLPQDELRSLLSKASAFIFSSVWYEPFGLVIIESMSMKTPVIASKIGAASAMITDGYDGLCFKSGDASDLICKLNYWMALPDAEKQTYCDNSRLTYTRFYTPKHNLKQLNAIYSNS